MPKILGRGGILRGRQLQDGTGTEGICPVSPQLPRHRKFVFYLPLSYTFHFGGGKNLNLLLCNRCLSGSTKACYLVRFVAMYHVGSM